MVNLIDAEELRIRIAKCEEELARLKLQLEAAEARRDREADVTPDHGQASSSTDGDEEQGVFKSAHLSASLPLLLQEYKRYGRQLIMPEIGLRGQVRLKNVSVLIVGVGGLGSSASAYLAGAGVGTIGLADGDVVDLSNLHRQIVHSTDRIGQLKVDSAIVYLKGLNPNVSYIPHRTHLQADTALDIVRSYDWVLDCSDNPATRYLVSDVCVLLGKPLVSASALQADGQLMIFNHPTRSPGDMAGGPCYRCMFPKPPPPETVMTCGDGGILGPVVGIMGVLQALTALRLITSPATDSKTTTTNGSSQTTSSSASHDEPGSAQHYGLIFSAFSSTPFRTFRMRKRRSACAACSTEATIGLDSLLRGSLDYEQFCGSHNPSDVLSMEERVSPLEYSRLEASEIVTIDTRDPTQFEICHLKSSINIPFVEIPPEVPSDETSGESDTSEQDWLRRLRSEPRAKPFFLVCRHGNDSQVAVQRLQRLGLDLDGERSIKDVKGGLQAYRLHVDPTFPDY